jgi:hypothetical protein
MSGGKTMTSSLITHSQKVTFAAPERILVATDLNDSHYLIPYVVAQAKASNSHVTLLHAVIPANSFPIEAGAIPYIDRESIDKDARALLSKMAQEIQSQGISCDVELRHGFASGRRPPCIVRHRRDPADHGHAWTRQARPVRARLGRE